MQQRPFREYLSLLLCIRAEQRVHMPPNNVDDIGVVVVAVVMVVLVDVLVCVVIVVLQSLS